MKILALMSLLLLASCSSSNELGQCIGLNDTPKPDLVYKYSARNIAVGIIFLELIAPPIVVALNELQCPVEKKQ